LFFPNFVVFLLPIDPYIQTHEEAKGAKFNALCRLISFRLQSKPRMLPTISEEEDQQQTKHDIAAATLLYPFHERILLLQAECLGAENEYDEAIGLLDELMEKESENILAVMTTKASLLTSEAFQVMETPSEEDDYAYAQELFTEAQAIYEVALRIDPIATEILSQYAQLKAVILMDVGGAVNLLRRAVGCVRSKEELVEMLQMLLSHEAQYKVLSMLLPSTMTQTPLTEK
jgi:tetratricopeptide (TPR) repeat protein